jgi:hypothetical protein
MREIDIVDALANGLQGPQSFCGTTYFVLRITACGAAFRASKNEFVWRDESVWLTPTMCARWAGAPVLISHPRDGVVDTESFVNTVIGSIVRAFVRDGELLGVARIVDANAAAMLETQGADTSPAVVLPETIKPVVLENGERWLVEPPPVLCDHLAIVPRGVWSQKTGVAGVEN